jgi:hypothetical protein
VEQSIKQRFNKLARRSAPIFLLLSLLSFGGLCSAQDVEVNAPQAHGSGSASLPSGYLELVVPLQERVSALLYGYYIGNADAPSAQLDVPIRATKFLTITPSYLYYRIPASGLNELASRPAGFTQSYEEHQFRIDGTVKFSFHKFEISERNMYVRRFRPTDEINRYRSRIMIAHPLKVGSHTWKPFASYEAFYEWPTGGWNRNRVWSGVTVPLNHKLSFQPSYMWEGSHGLKDVNYLMFGLIFNTGKRR